MATAVGIDLGTTNSVIAATEAGKPTVVPNAEGSRTTPSVVAFTPHGERLVGQLAGRQAILNPRGTTYSAKRFIGRRFDEVQTQLNAVSFDVVAGPDGAARFEIGGKQYAPEEISALVLRKLAEDASKFLGEKVTEAVITVPAAAELQQVYHGLGAAASAASGASNRLDQQPGAPQPGGPQGNDSDDVIDGEFTTHE